MGQLLNEVDSDETELGSGWISGMLSIALAIVGLSVVLCLMYPQLLTIADVRAYYHVGAIRLLVHMVLVTAFFLGGISVTLRHSKVLGFTGMILVLVATLMGGSHASQRLEGQSDIYLGLDFFLLNLILLGSIFIPIERVFKQREQPILRGEWREDLFYFLVSTLFVQGLAYLSLTPALTILAGTQWANGFREVVASQPVVLQFFEIMFFTDLVQYGFHRAFHEIPWLWRFHSVHHSAKHMDWIAGSRMHLFEIVLLRAFTTLPMYVMGFAEPALYAYIFFVFLLSVFVHSNVRFRFPILEHIMATPRFHHWHHGIEKEAINVNYAVHFPFLDRLFGTHHLPKEEWPEGYGIAGHPVPVGYWQQFLHPFRKNRTEQGKSETSTGGE